MSNGLKNPTKRYFFSHNPLEQAKYDHAPEIVSLRNNVNAINNSAVPAALCCSLSSSIF